eukprot:7923656-Ditylum_brightwellii.AAC.1
MHITSTIDNSVSTEYADGVRVENLANKSKKVPLKRLEIARDITNGLADMHGINGNGTNGDRNRGWPRKCEK